MKEIDIYTRAAVTILGLAYPILLQVIARLDEKYASNLIVELFDNEFEKKAFGVLLAIAIISVFVWSFHFAPLIQVKGFNYLINHSASILVLVSTTVLVFTFFYYVNKILIYYTPSKFIDYLIAGHNKNPGELKYFKALTDVFLLSIQKQNQAISEKIARFFYDAFYAKREKSTVKPVEYPLAYYSLVYRSIEELAIIKNKKNRRMEKYAAGGQWLMGENGYAAISDTTYSWLWDNCVLAITYEQDDLILHHWERCHNYYAYSLTSITPEYDTISDGHLNEDAMNVRMAEREKFWHFHFALGGLLLYKKRYKAIQRIFSFTTSVNIFN